MQKVSTLGKFQSGNVISRKRPFKITSKNTSELHKIPFKTQNNKSTIRNENDEQCCQNFYFLVSIQFHYLFEHQLIEVNLQQGLQYQH